MGNRRDKELLSREVDDLLLQARGLVLVRRVLAERGVSPSELDAHTAELERVRAQLAATLQGGARPLDDAA
jgi:hypothetical protein